MAVPIYCVTEDCNELLNGGGELDILCTSCVRAENARRMKETNDGGSYMAFSQIVEGNGKTIRENNMEEGHDYQVGDLVEFKTENWHGDGACDIVHGRYWIVDCGRDCDGTPLYWLSKVCPGGKRDRVMMYYPDSNMGGPDYRCPGGLPGIMFNEDMSRNIIDGRIGGFPHDSLTKIEVTSKVVDGEDCLTIPRKLSEVPYKPEMLCASCDKVTTFEHIKEHKGERPDWICTVCDWMQTSTEGGYCETVTSWLHKNGEGLMSHDSAKEQLGKFIHRTCQGEYGEHYADVLAKALIALLGRRYQAV